MKVSKYLGAGFILLGTPAVFADIIINIDSPNKTITASGSVTGTTDNIFNPGGGVAWGASVIGVNDVSSLFSASGPATPFDSASQTYDLSTGWSLFWDRGNGFSDVNVSTTGASINYSTWSSADQAAVEATIGQTITKIFGQSSDVFSITGTSVSAIPEPASIGGLAGLLMSGFFLRRRVSK
jgi:hypothetical protein